MSHTRPQKRSGKSAARLLVVNADPEDRYTLSEALQADAYEMVFCDSLDARDPRLFDDRSCDVWIIGLNHPAETCFDLLATIKRKCPLTEVIILSRLADEKLWIESIQRGAYEFLSKPLDRKDFQRIVTMPLRKIAASIHKFSSLSNSEVSALLGRGASAVGVSSRPSPLRWDAAGRTISSKKRLDQILPSRVSSGLG